MEMLVWLVDDPLMKAEWKSASMERGGQCVTLDGIAVMQELYADNWGSLDQVLRVMVFFHPSTQSYQFFIYLFIYLFLFFSGNSTLWLSAQLWTRNWPSISVSCGVYWDRVFITELQSQWDLV